MTSHGRHLLARALAAALLGSAAGAALAQAPQPQLRPEPAGAAAAMPTRPELPVLLISSVEVMHSAGQPDLDIVRVNGLAASRGWHDPQLVPTYSGKPNDGILDLQLIAVPPEESEDADGFGPMTAIFVIDDTQPISGVRVRGADNAVTLAKMPGTATATIDISDCHDCLGRTFAESNDSHAGQQGVVARGTLPRALRVLRPADGIEGVPVADPNRLTLILNDQDVIEEAFWE